MNLKHRQKWQQFKTYINSSLKLTTHKITVISVLLALTTFISLFEIPTFFAAFLTVDFGNTINLIAVLIVKLPYGLLIGLIVPWLRLILPHIGSSGNAIGELSYMLSTITLLLLYSGFHMVFKQLPWWKDQPTNWWKRLIIVEVPTAIIVCILVSLINTFLNWSFLLELWGAGYLKNELWIIILPYNLFKFTFVLSLFVVLVRPVQILIQHFNF